MRLHSLTSRILPTTAALALAGTALVAAPSSAHASPCGTAATYASDAWNEYYDVAAKIGCVAGSALAVADFSTCYAGASTYKKTVDSMVSWYNKLVGNTWAHLGQRSIEIGASPLSGTLQTGVATRVFCTAAPLDGGDIKVRITKDGGKAKTDVEICKMKKDGSAISEFEYTWDKGNGNIGTTQSRTVTSSRDKILCVKLDNKSFSKKFSYKISAEKL